MTRESIELKAGSGRRQGDEPAGSGWSYRPRMDVREGPEEFTVFVDMPGTTIDDIAIDFGDGALSIHGRVAARQRRDIEFLAHEFGIGDFDRELVLADVIDADGIAAEYERGVLTVHLPKSEKARPRRIPVRAM